MADETFQLLLVLVALASSVGPVYDNGTVAILQRLDQIENRLAAMEAQMIVSINNKCGRTCLFDQMIATMGNCPGTTKMPLDTTTDEPLDTSTELPFDATTEAMVEPEPTPSQTVVVLRRQDGSVNFIRDWAAYKVGFGNESEEFWLGLDNLHTLTENDYYTLAVNLTDWNDETKWDEYYNCSVASEANNYRKVFSAPNLASTAGKSLLLHNGDNFTTYDRDNEDDPDVNCAVEHYGGWWYNDCGYTAPTGLYLPAGDTSGDGIVWTHAYGDDRSFREITIKLIPA